MDKKLNNLFRHSIGRSLRLAAVMLFAVQGCVTIDDNTDDCFPMASLRLEYTYNMDGQDRFRHQVESLDLYVYKKDDGSLVANKCYTQADLIKLNYTLPLSWLGQGNYEIVVFGNLDARYYSCHAFEKIGDMRLRMLCSDGLGTVRTNPGTFFHGKVEIGKDDTEEKVVSMIKNTNDINVTVRNKTITRAGGEGLPDLTISIAVRNGTLKHDNSIAGDDPRTMTHISDNEFPQYATSLTATMTVGRLFSTDGSTVSIKEKNTGKVLSTDNLTEKIIELLRDDADHDGVIPPDEYLDRKDSYDLVYDVEMKHGALVTTLISINGWNVEQNPIGGI